MADAEQGRRRKITSLGRRKILPTIHDLIERLRCGQEVKIRKVPGKGFIFDIEVTPAGIDEAPPAGR